MQAAAERMPSATIVTPEATGIQDLRRDEARGSRREGTSRRTSNRHLTLIDDGRGVLKRSGDVFKLEVGIVAQQLVDGSTSGELPEHHAHCYAEAADARQPAHLRRVHSDAIESHGTDDAMFPSHQAAVGPAWSAYDVRLRRDRVPAL